MRIVSFLGTLTLAASVFFLFYQFWGRFSTVSQVVILIAAALLSFAATVFIAVKDRSGYFAKGCLGGLLCCLEW
jgi:multisubunit Na+/H+ antiporter MnhF subunit